MFVPWAGIVIAALTLLVLYQQFRMYQVRRSSRNREELFQIVTENAADMIALVDMKGRRLYNSPAYKKVLGYSPAELGELRPSSRFIPMIASKYWKRRGRRGKTASANGWNTASSIRTEAGAFWNRLPARCATLTGRLRSW